MYLNVFIKQVQKRDKMSQRHAKAEYDINIYFELRLMQNPKIM